MALSDFGGLPRNPAVVISNKAMVLVCESSDLDTVSEGGGSNTMTIGLSSDINYFYLGLAEHKTINSLVEASEQFEGDDGLMISTSFSFKSEITLISPITLEELDNLANNQLALLICDPTDVQALTGYASTNVTLDATTGAFTAHLIVDKVNLVPKKEAEYGSIPRTTLVFEKKDMADMMGGDGADPPTFLSREIFNNVEVTLTGL